MKGKLHIYDLSDTLERQEWEIEFDELVALTETESTLWVMFTFGMRTGPGVMWKSVMITYNGKAYGDKTYAVYDGKEYSGIDGFRRLEIAMEQEKIRGLLDGID